MVHPKTYLVVAAGLAVGLPLLPAHAQTGQATHPQAGARHGAMHGTASVHPTPKRQHMMEQMQRAHVSRQQGDPQHADTDRLNAQSLQRAQQGEGAAPAGAGLTGAAPDASPAAPVR